VEPSRIEGKSMSDVSIVRCADYDPGRVTEAVRRSLDLIGGIGAFVKPGNRVLLKASLLMRRKPEKATTTHPEIVRAVAQLVREAGGFPLIGDSPGGYHFYTRATLASVYETCGMRDAAERSGAELNFDTDAVDVPFPEGKVIKLVKTIRPVVDADVIISLPKLKTHMMTVYSGAVKNLFGIIPGSYKAEYHLRFEDTGDFADLLIDLCAFAKPALTVMDAVVGMEGHGPTAGSPRAVGLVLSSRDPYALDSVAVHLIGLDPHRVPTIVKAEQRGLCPADMSGIRVLGERPADVAVLDFEKPTVKMAFNYYSLFIPRWLKKRLDSVIKPKPRFDHELCIGCGMCAQGCPPRTIEMKDGKPVVDLSRCIRCFCCSELCAHGAVTIFRPWFIRMVLR
jgi:uncharacterized protein (DUF362 family)/Pyruvate/2-oxoacid:ferredoxin oxidoreductase delta subunit